jgi:hypothetical protein
MSSKIKPAFLLIVALTIFTANAQESSVEMDKSRVFPVQKNPLIEHSQRVDKSSANAEEADSKKPASKDTSLRIDGNGGSTNRSAGGKAMLKQRIPFD